ncbi:uncharacterized protein GGS25DRAFT_486580, partial [Hypoxylon fragiforme]|uniref:uncharacterized protein n=1 Tax=Hypoxylon fragiforme TaxID=63214 RepID=UPI0020C5DAC8
MGGRPWSIWSMFSGLATLVILHKFLATRYRALTRVDRPQEEDLWRSFLGPSLRKIFSEICERYSVAGEPEAQLVPHSSVSKGGNWKTT